MRLSCVLFVAVATFLAISDAVSTADAPSMATSTATRWRSLRSYNKDKLEGENEERFEIPISKAQLREFAQRLQAERAQAQARTLNVGAILRSIPTRAQELDIVTRYFATRGGVLGGWLEKATLDTLRTQSPGQMRGTFAEWKSQGKTLEDLAELLNANEYVKKEYSKVFKFYEMFLKMPGR